MTRVGVLRDPGIAAGIGQFARHPVSGAVVRHGGEPDRRARRRRDRARHRGIRALSQRRPDRDRRADLATSIAKLIVALAARHRCRRSTRSAIFVTDGGLISYGPIMSTSTARGRLRRSHPQGREAGRSAGAGADQVRTGASISRPPRRSASKFRRRCSPAPTR